MTDEQFFDFVFIAVIGIRFHPKNDETRFGIGDDVALAFAVAAEAVKQRCNLRSH